MPRVGAVPVRAAILGDRAEALGAIGLALGEPEWLARLGLVALSDGLALRPSPARVASGEAAERMSTTGRLRERNVALLVDALRDHGSASRADLARATGLSRTTVVSIVDELDRRGLIVEAPNGGASGERARGRPAGRVRLHPVSRRGTGHLRRP